MKAMKQVRRACNNPDREYSDLTQVGAMEVIKKVDEFRIYKF